MSKIIYLLCLLFLSMSCAKDYIEKPSDESSSIAAIELVSTYTSVDFSEFNIKYNRNDILQVQIRREPNETPLTVYDGDLVILDTTFQTHYMDYKKNIDEPSLNPNRDYYYSIFYKADSVDSLPVRVQDFKIQTLSYQQGMLQLYSELIDYSKSKNSSLEFIVSTEWMGLFYDDVGQPTQAISDASFMLKFDGVLVPELKYKKTDAAQDLDQLNQNHVLMENLVSTKKVLAVDYVSKSNGVGLSASQVNFSNRGIIGFNRPSSNVNLFNELSPVINEDENTSIASIKDEGFKNFIFLDTPVDNLLTSLHGTNYDLIIMSPFKSAPWSSFNDLYSVAEVTSLKRKSNTEAKGARLVFAYIDVSRVWKDAYYWQALWNEEVTRPKWIDRNVETNSNDYYVKYWRNDWKNILKPMLDKVIVRGYDGVVFGGGESFTKF